MTEPTQQIWLYHEKPAAADFRNAVEFAGFTDLAHPEYPAPAAPQILLVLAPDESFEIDSPNHILRLHEIQRGKRNGDGGGPAVRCDAAFRSPDAIPPGIAISRITPLFFGNQAVALRAQWVDLEHVGVTPIMRGINDYLEIIIELLSYIAS